MANELISKKHVITAVNTVIDDIEMLKDGTWIPDEHSCDDTLDNLELIRKYLES